MVTTTPTTSKSTQLASLNASLASAKSQLAAAQSAGYSGNQQIKTDSSGKIIPVSTGNTGGGSSGGNTGGNTPQDQQKLGGLNQQLSDAQAKLKELTDAGYSGSDTPSYDSSGKLIPKAQVPQTGQSGSGTYYARQPLAGGGDTIFANAQNALNPSNTPLSEEDFYKKIQDQIQPVLDAVKQAGELQSGVLTSEANATLGARGLAGSSVAAGDIASIKADQATKYATALKDLTTWAIPEASAEFQAAQTRNDTLAQNYINTSIQKAQNAIKGIASSGTSFSDFQKNNPDEFNSLLQYYSGDVNSMKADYLASIPNIDFSKAIQSGTNLVVPHVDPVTGKATVEVIDTGTQLTADDKVVKSADGGVVIYNTRTGQVQELGGGNPYYLANQGATLASKQAMLVSRYGTAVNNITKQLYPTPANNPLNLYSNSLNYTTKLNEAYKLSAASDTADKGPSDLELIDAAVKINNGGQQITETQVNSLFKSLNIGGKATIEGGKLTGTSALLTDDQRKAIKTLAENNIKAQKANALNAVNVIGERATRAGVPANMISTPEDIMALTAAANPTADAQSGTVQDMNGNSLQVTANADGTYTDSSGVNYDSEGNEI